MFQAGLCQVSDGACAAEESRFENMFDVNCSKLVAVTDKRRVGKSYICMCAALGGACYPLTVSAISDTARKQKRYGIPPVCVKSSLLNTFS